ncbi:MAG: hypothetical protein LBS16_06395 [Prevotellaceae bacterium]|jgi:hypothetical protein|nr:hypothetical protein [Prevotellaceae bacterium]
MRKFVIRISVFLLIVSIGLALDESYRLLSDKYQKDHKNNLVSVYHTIAKSKKKKKTKKILLGDSVAQQLYPNLAYNDSIYSLACNQTITVAGHYFLLNNFVNINKNELPEEVIFFYRPLSLKDNLGIYSFSYFLKPFYNREYKSLMDTCLIKRIKTIPLYFISQFPLIKTSNYTPKFCVPQEEPFNEIFSPITKNYLKKIEQLCRNNNLRFRFEPAPISKSEWDTLQLFNNIDYPLDTMIIKNYFQHIQYFEDSLFIDDVHFKPQYIPQDYLNLIGNAKPTHHTTDSLGILK